MKFPAGTYDEDQLKVLMTAFEMACKELGVREDDSDSRERIAATLLVLAGSGQADPETLKRYAIAQFEGRRTKA